MAEEHEKGVPMVLAPQMGAIDATVESIRYRAQLIARNQKLDFGVAAPDIGFAAGLLFSLLMVIVLPVAVGL
nr:N5 methyltetrahydromethanopterin:coenzyme M methyltransferase subunit MtrF [Methanosarcina mazei Go1]